MSLGTGIVNSDYSSKRQRAEINDNEQKLRRLARNRDSARECRKRKKDKYEVLRKELVHLEAENLQLRMKLKIGPEFAAEELKEASQFLEHLDGLLTAGATDETIKNAIHEVQQRYADYGRDRRSAIDFHINSLRKCLQPTQTTRTVLWLMSCVNEFHNEDGSLKPKQEGIVADLWYSLLNALQATGEQNLKLVTTVGADSFNSQKVPILEEVSKKPEQLIQRLESLIANKNDNLDTEMKKLQSLFSVRQIAKFMVWTQKNPVCMQMIEALWPHLQSQIGGLMEEDAEGTTGESLTTSSSSSSLYVNKNVISNSNINGNFKETNTENYVHSNNSSNVDHSSNKSKISASDEYLYDEEEDEDEEEY